MESGEMMPHEITGMNICRSFLLTNEDECVHIIETGYLLDTKKYLVVKEDAYQEKIGQSELLSIAEIKDKFNIEL